MTSFQKSKHFLIKITENTQIIKPTYLHNLTLYLPLKQNLCDQIGLLLKGHGLQIFFQKGRKYWVTFSAILKTCSSFGKPAVAAFGASFRESWATFISKIWSKTFPQTLAQMQNTKLDFPKFNPNLSLLSVITLQDKSKSLVHLSIPNSLTHFF